MHQKSESSKKPMRVRGSPNREQAATILFHMKRSGVTQLQISKQAGVCPQMVQSVVYGLRTSGRVQKAIAAALGFESWTALTSRKGVAA